MIRSAEVFLWGTRIGVVYQGENDIAAGFEYDKDFLKSGIEPAPFKMPLADKIYTFPELSRSEAFHGLPGLVADSLPDKFGNAVIDQWLSMHGRTPESFTAVERLCYTGTRGMGALEYVPDKGPQSINKSIDVDEMVEFAARVLDNREQQTINDSDMDMLQMIEIGSSAGGARAKAVIAWNEKTGEVRSGQIEAGDGFDYWLIKFDGVNGNGDHGVKDPKQYTLIEYAYYLMAKDTGIDMSECRIFDKEGLKHFMTRRFDRRDGRKVHMQTLSALGHFDFNYPNQCSYEMYAQYARRLGIGKKGIEELYRRMVFNVAGVNCDDHVKNFTFLMDMKGSWNLSPAYDLCFSYSPRNRWINAHQMSVNGRTKEISYNDLMECGKTMGLNASKCKDIIERVGKTVADWMLYADKCGINEKRALEVSKLLNEKGIH